MAKKVTVELDKTDKLYLKEVTKGLGVTARHMFKNLFAKKDRYTDTLSYPEERVTYSKRWRGMHRLLLRKDGKVRCVACYMCATICPAKCIEIEAAEGEAGVKEKYPKSFKINELRCIFCGLCVEACPEDAIRMDTGVHVEPFKNREDAIFDLNRLIDNNKYCKDAG